MKEILARLPHLNTQEELPPHLPEANSGLASFVKERLSSLDSGTLSLFQKEYQDENGKLRRRITEAGRDFAQELYQEMLFQTPGCSFETLSKSLSLAYQELKQEGFENLSQVRSLFSSIRGQKRARDLRYEAVHKLGIKPEGGIVSLQRKVAQARREKEHQKSVDKAVRQTRKAKGKETLERVRRNKLCAGMALLVLGSLVLALNLGRDRQLTPPSVEGKERPAVVLSDPTFTLQEKNTLQEEPPPKASALNLGSWEGSSPSPPSSPPSKPDSQGALSGVKEGTTTLSSSSQEKKESGIIFDQSLADQKPPREESPREASQLAKTVEKKTPDFADFDLQKPVTFKVGEIVNQKVMMVVGTLEELQKTQAGGQGKIALEKGKILRVRSTKEDIPDQTAFHTWSVIITQIGVGAPLVKKVQKAGGNPAVLIGEIITYRQDGQEIKEVIIDARIVSVEKHGQPKEVFPEAKKGENVIWTCYRWTLRGTTHVLVLRATSLPQAEPIIPQGLSAE